MTKHIYFDSIRGPVKISVLSVSGSTVTVRSTDRYSEVYPKGFVFDCKAHNIVRLSPNQRCFTIGLNEIKGLLQ